MKHIIICLSVISLLFASCKTPKSATEIPVRVKSEVKKQYDRILEKHNEWKRLRQRQIFLFLRNKEVL